MTAARPRTVVSPSRFCWLLAPDGTPGAPPTSVDEVALVASELARAWQILPHTFPRFVAWLDPAHRTLLPVKRLGALAEAILIFARLQASSLIEAAKAFDAEGIPYVAIKGCATRFTVWDQPEYRCGRDGDIAVLERDLGAARRVLEGLGYVAAQWDEGRRRFEQADPHLRRQVEAQHYELGYLVREERVHGLTAAQRTAIFDQMSMQPWAWHPTPTGDLAVYQMIDVHHGLALGISAEPVIADRRPARFGATPAWVPSPAWTLFHAVYKLYWEGVHHYREGIHHYADIIRVTQRLTASDVAEARALFARWNLRAAAWFVLRRVEMTFGVRVDPALHAMLDEFSIPDERTGCLDQNDYGDVWPKLWGRR